FVLSLERGEKTFDCLDVLRGVELKAAPVQRCVQWRIAFIGDTFVWHSPHDQATNPMDCHHGIKNAIAAWFATVAVE
ncbi:MAG TPA: hypothetical protein VJ823_03835, partial [Rhodanobacteraceae bacterium]|nr:hypothetical protein [Rhodanobacteraceae bacterium]